MLVESISVAIEACEDDSSKPPGAGVLAASGSLERPGNLRRYAAPLVNSLKSQIS